MPTITTGPPIATSRPASGETPYGSFTGSPTPYDTLAPFVGATCDNTDSLPFDQFSAQAKAIGAQSFVTVNYGSGTPAEAAGWVTHSLTTPGDSVALSSDDSGRRRGHPDAGHFLRRQRPAGSCWP
jgi:hypothetical protein